MPTHQKPRVWSALPPLRPGGVPAQFSWIVVNSKPSRERSLRDALDIAGFSTLLLFVQEERIKLGWPPQVAAQENVLADAVWKIDQRLRYLRFITPEELDGTAPNPRTAP